MDPVEALIHPWFVTSARVALAVVLIGAGLLKSRRIRSFVSSIDELRIMPDRALPLVALTVIVAEIAVGSGLLFSQTLAASSWVAIALLTLFTSVVLLAMSRRQRFRCNCFGSLSAERTGAGTVLRNGLLIALAVVLTASGSSVGWDALLSGDGRIAIPLLSLVWLSVMYALESVNLGVIRVMVGSSRSIRG
jgi:uncharacterized membrane protein YphA (DoxX/SURF4 family)